jgi:NOL1/NOP2/sun family putative RNA methylase
MSKKKRHNQQILEIPADFKDRLANMYSESVCRQIDRTFVQRPTTFRINTIKADSAATALAIKKQNFRLRPVSWYPDAWILENRSHKDLMETEEYKNGLIYVQSLASMIPPLILDPTAGDKVFDLTAAPGSKTSQMAAIMETTGELVANDNNQVRFARLEHNMHNLGVVSPRNDIDWTFILRLENGPGLCDEYLGYFDKILLDAPCSAEARFILDQPKTFAFWKEKKIKDMAYAQRKLLFAAWNALKPGGTLVYSTCTFAPEENEMQISRLKERYGDEVQIEKIELKGLAVFDPITNWKDHEFHTDMKKTLRIKPTSDVEGFYVAKLTKKVM